MLRDGRHRVMVRLTSLVVQLADELYDGYQKLQGSICQKVAPVIDDETWFAFYRRPRWFHRQLTREGEGIAPGLRMAVCLARVMTRLPGVAKRYQRNDPQAFGQLLQMAADPTWMRQFRWSSLSWLVRLVRTWRQGDMELIRVDPAVFFFATVWVPCMLRHAATPQALFERAARGSRNSLRDLIALDPRVIHAFELRPLVESSLVDDSGKKHLHATSSPFAGKRGRTAFKCTLSACLIAQSEAAAFDRPRLRLGPADLRNAFDAFARQQGHLRDDDLQDSPEAFRREVIRRLKNVRRTPWNFFGLEFVTG